VSAQPKKIFVYGTLMRGESNHRLLAGARLLALVRTAPRYTLVSLGGFPGLIEGGRTSVVGEVYALTGDAMLAALDRLEGHPRFYERKLVTLARPGLDGSVEGYVLPPSYRDEERIDSGDWRAHRAASSRRSPLDEGLADLARGRMSHAAVQALIALRRGRL
jgi:gamma-glutamylcyclotransferase (GGCT)/AIG2-like uncharacterized protein YtfP